MAVAIRTEMYSLDEAVKIVLNRAMAGESVARVASEVVDFLDKDALYECARIGLGAKAHDLLAQARGGADLDVDDALASTSVSVLPRALPTNRHYAKTYWLAVLARNYEGADKTRRALFEFGVADCEHLRDVAAGKAAGYGRLRDAMAVAIGHLEQTGAARIDKLPQDAQREIAEALA